MTSVSVRKAVGNAGRYEHPESVVGVDVERKRGLVRRRSLSQVVQHDPRPTLRHRPVVRLVKVVVQADDGAGLALGRGSPWTISRPSGNQLRR